MPEIRCETCGATIQAGESICPKCGAPTGAPTGAKNLFKEPAQPTQVTKQKIDRLVVVGDGFAPSPKDLGHASRLLRETNPELLPSEFATAVEWRGGVPRQYTSAPMADAIMATDWGAALLRQHFKEVYARGAKVFFLEFTNAAARRLVAVVASGATNTPAEENVEADRFKPVTTLTRYPSLHPLGKVSLETLTSPLFQRKPPSGAEPALAQQETIRRLVAPASLHGSVADSQALEQATRNLPADFPGFALGYLWRVVAFSGLGKFEEAFSLLETGFELCADPLHLCEACAHLCERTGSIAQFGWHMQQCYLGTRSYWPFLVLAQAAVSSGMQYLSRSLFAASDIVDGTGEMWRPSPTQATRIESLVSNNLAAILSALARFYDHLAPALNELQSVPEDPALRGAWLREKQGLRKSLVEKLTAIQ